MASSLALEGDDFLPSTCSLPTPEELDGDDIRIALGCLTDKSAVAWYEVALPTFVEGGEGTCYFYGADRA